MDNWSDLAFGVLLTLAMKNAARRVTDRLRMPSSRTMPRSLAVLLVLVSTPALAQPGVDDAAPAPDVIVLQPGPAPQQPPVLPATPAPQNEQWSNVSHINGQVVPVGERGNYLHKWKT